MHLNVSQKRMFSNLPGFVFKRLPFSLASAAAIVVERTAWLTTLLSTLSATMFVTLCLASTPLGATVLEKMTIAVSIPPQKYFVERIAGNQVDVMVMVEPGQSPETYAPTPRKMASLNNAKIYFGIGMPFEKTWIQRIAKMNPRMKLVQMEQGLRLRFMEKPMQQSRQQARDSGHQHDHFGEPDPHVWTNPRLVMQMAGTIKTALIELLPAQKQRFEENYQRFVQDLSELDKYISDLSNATASKQFMVFHPSWGYFADAYGLHQIPIESEGKFPGAKSLSHLVDLAKREKINVIFVQQQFSQRDAATIAKAIDGSVVQVDPLAENYIENLKSVANVFTGGVK